MWGTHVPSDSSFQVIYYALALILIFDPSESHKNCDSLFIILCFDLLSTSVRFDIRNFHIYLMCRPVVWILGNNLKLGYQKKKNPKTNKKDPNNKKPHK